MRQGVFLFIYFYAVLLTLTGCGDGKSVRQSHLGDTPYQQDTIMVTYATNPERALTLLDSALLLGNISEYRGQCIRARIYSKSLVAQRQDSAILICKELLGHDSVRNEPSEQENILDLLITTSRAKPDYEQYLHWATQKAGLCQQQGQETERWRTEADIGLVMTHLGQEDEGLAKLDEAIGHLDAPGSIDRMDAFIVAVKRKINALNAQRRYEEVIPLAQRILDRLDHFEQHANDYAEDSYRLAWNDNPNERDRYLDFSRAQAWGFMAIAYSHTQNPPKGEESRYLSLAKKYLSLFDNSGYGKTFSARRMVSPAQMALGMYDEALATYDELERRMAGDTLNEDYAIILRSRAIAAHARNRHAEAYDYQTRYANLSKVLSDSLMKGKAHEYAARYHDQEQKLEIAQMNAESQRKTIIIWAAVIIILLISIFATWFLRQWQVIRRKNLVLVEQIGQAIEYKVKYEAIVESLTPTLSPKDKENVKGEASDDTLSLNTEQETSATPTTSAIESELLSLDDVSNDELYRHLRHVIKREHLYLDPTLDRQKIMDIFQLSRRRVGAAFAQGSEFASLTDFIRDCRLEYSCELLLTRPDLSIKEIAAKSGFNYASTYSANFKNRYTVTPSSYRELMTKK